MQCDFCEHKGIDPVTQMRYWCVPLMKYVDLRPRECPRRNETYGPCHNVKFHFLTKEQELKAKKIKESLDKTQ